MPHHNDYSRNGRRATPSGHYSYHESVRTYVGGRSDTPPAYESVSYSPPPAYQRDPPSPSYSHRRQRSYERLRPPPRQRSYERLRPPPHQRSYERLRSPLRERRYSLSSDDTEEIYRRPETIPGHTRQRSGRGWTASEYGDLRTVSGTLQRRPNWTASEYGDLNSVNESLQRRPRVHFESPAEQYARRRRDHFQANPPNGAVPARRSERVYVPVAVLVPVPVPVAVPVAVPAVPRRAHHGERGGITRHDHPAHGPGGPLAYDYGRGPSLSRQARDVERRVMRQMQNWVRFG